MISELPTHCADCGEQREIRIILDFEALCHDCTMRWATEEYDAAIAMETGTAIDSEAGVVAKP